MSGGGRREDGKDGGIWEGWMNALSIHI